MSENGLPPRLEVVVGRLQEQINSVEKDILALDRLTESRFVTHRTLLDSQAAQTALALSAADKLTLQAFAASEKAIEKAEIAQQAYNARSNEFRQALSDSGKENVSRVEADSKFATFEEKLAEIKKDFERYKDGQVSELRDLRESRSEGRGARVASTESKQDNRWLYGALVGLIGLLLAITNFVRLN